MNVLPCLMGFHHSGPWQDRVSHHRPPEWHPRVRFCRKCGRRQEAHRSIEPPFRMIQSRWRKPQCVATSADCTKDVTGIHMPTNPYCPAPDRNPSVAQTPVWVCPRKSCLSHTDQIPDAFCGQCSHELHRRQAAGLDPYTAQPLPEPQINPRQAAMHYQHGYRNGINHAVRFITEAIAVTGQPDDPDQNQMAAVREALRKLEEQ